MARQRINYGFLVGLGSAFLVAGAGAGALWIFRKPHNPAPLIEAGKQAFEKQDYVTAAENYAAASALLPQQADLHLRVGECCVKLASVGGVDMERVKQGIDEFNHAVQLDPGSIEAWIGLLQLNDSWVSAIEGHERSDSDRQFESERFTAMRDAAEHVLKIDPNNATAKASRAIITLRMWMLNLALPDTPEIRALPLEQRPTADARAEDAIKALTAVVAEHPESDKLPFWIARAKVFEGLEVLKKSRTGDAGAFFAEASTAFDQSIAAKPDSITLYLEKAEILARLSNLDGTPGTDYANRRHDTLQIAQAKADPVKNPEDYENAKAAWAEVVREKDPTGSEEIIQDLIKRFPEQIALRVRLAQYLMQDHRNDEALAGLAEINTLPGPAITDLRRRELWDSQVAAAKLLSARIMTEQLQATPPGDKRKQLVKDITACLDDARKQLSGKAMFLRELGRFQLVNGQKRDAIDTITLAVEKMKLEGSAIDYDLLNLQATANTMGEQNKTAVTMLESQMASNPAIANSADAHFRLVDMCLKDQDYAKAKKYNDWLVQRLPEDPRVVRFQIEVLGPAATWDEVKDLYAKLPEKTPGDQALKVRYAMRCKKYDEAIRQLQMLNKTNPGETTVAVDLAALLKNADQMPQAYAVLDECIKRNPGNPMLKSVRDSMDSNLTHEAVVQDTIDAIEKIQDPYTREMSYIRFYQSQQRPDEMRAHLLKAIELQPDDKKALSTLFVLYLNSKRFNEAQAMLPRLSELDVDDAHGMIFRIKLALAMNDVQNAVTLAEKFTQVESNFAGSWELYGEAEQAAGRLENATEQYRRALQMQGNNSDALNRLIYCDVKLKKTPEARAALADACARFPADPIYRNMRQRFEIENYDPTSVLPELDAQIAAHPDATDGYTIEIEALRACVHGKVSDGNPVAAAEYNQRLLARYREAVQRWPDDLNFSNGLAQYYAENKDLDNAEKVMTAVSKTPRWVHDPRPLTILGQIYLSAGKLDLAEATLNKALAIQSSWVDALLALSECKQRQGDSETALAKLYPAIDDFQVRIRYTEILLQNPDKWAQAEVEVGNALQKDPKNGILKNLMLMVYLREGKRDQGIALADEAINSDASNLNAYLWRAKLLLSGPAPALEAAAKDLNRYLDVNPAAPDAHLLLAQVIETRGDRDGAITELENARKLAPEDRQIRLALTNEYLKTVPPRDSELERLLTETVSMPQFSADPEFQFRLAEVLAKKKDRDSRERAVAMMQKAMKDAGMDSGKNAGKPAENALLAQYFSVLLASENYELMLTESDKYVNDPKCPWFVFSDRGVAKAALGDPAGAVAEFNTAMDRASVEPGRMRPMVVVQSISATKSLGLHKAIELVLARAKDNPMWQMIAAELLLSDHDLKGATAQAESAMVSIDKLTPADQFYLMHLTSGLYTNASPPVVDKALELYRKMLKIQPDNYEAMNDMACILCDMSVPPKPAEALVWSQKAYDLCLKNGQIPPRVADTQGWVLMQNDKVTQGIEVLHNAIDQANFPDAHYHLAMGFIKQKAFGNARFELDLAAQMLARDEGQKTQVDPSLKAKIDAAREAAKGDGATPAGKT